MLELEVSQHHLVPLLVLSATIAWCLFNRSCDLPGPPSVPILGSLLWLGKKPFVDLVKSEWKEKYGPVFKVDFGMRRMFIVCEESASKELLISKSIHLGGRPRLFFYQEELGLENNFVPMCSSENEMVDPCRRLNTKLVRDVGTFAAQPASLEIIQHIASLITQSSQLDLHEISRLWATLTMLKLSHGLELNVKQLENCQPVSNLIESIEGILSMVAFDSDLSSIFPIVATLTPWRSRRIKEKARSTRENFISRCKDMDKFARETLELESSDKEDWPNSTLKYSLTGRSPLDVSHAMTQCAVTLGAGVHTQTISLMAIIVVTAFSLDQQEKLRAEIRATATRLGQADHPFPLRALAMVRETLRAFPPVPSTTPRLSDADLWVNGKRIPKGSIVFPIIETINDQSPWDSEKYLTMLEAEGKSKSESNHFSFGFGRRICPAAHFAERNLALILSHLVQNFEIKFPDEIMNQGKNLEEALDMRWVGMNKVSHAGQNVIFRNIQS